MGIWDDWVFICAVVWIKNIEEGFIYKIPIKDILKDYCSNRLIIENPTVTVYNLIYQQNDDETDTRLFYDWTMGDGYYVWVFMW